jgi:16S rRNA (adenine1518-N6/adenine1519-N6)-dimethyltransferase
MSLRNEYTMKPQQPSAPERLKPRKDLGQNFLKDRNIAHNIVKALELHERETVIEIGPGEGALTSLLMETNVRNVIAIEYDARAVELLQTRFHAAITAGRLRIIHSDVLKLTFDKIFAENSATPDEISIVGNIPYYITSDILFWIFDEWAKHSAEIVSKASQQHAWKKITLRKAVIMMQKEVAERITAKPRTKEYGILSVASLLVSEPKILFHVPPQCFFPPPKVTSSVVEFRMKAGAEASAQFRAVHPLVRVAFNQRRKVLSNALSGVLPKERLPELLAAAEMRKISYFRSRAEELTPHDFMRLHELIAEFR